MFLGGFAANTFIPVPGGDDMGFPTITVVGVWGDPELAAAQIKEALGIDNLVATVDDPGYNLRVTMYAGSGYWAALDISGSPDISTAWSESLPPIVIGEVVTITCIAAEMVPPIEGGGGIIS